MNSTLNQAKLRQEFNLSEVEVELQAALIDTKVTHNQLYKLMEL